MLVGGRGLQRIDSRLGESESSLGSMTTDVEAAGRRPSCRSDVKPRAVSKHKSLLEPAVSTSAPPRCLDGGDVDLLHRHHRLEGTLCLTATSRKRVG